MCCASGKVQLPEIETPPEPLNGLLIGTDPDSNVFLKRIVSELDALLNEHNELLKIFKSHMHQLQSDNHAIVINPDKTPAGGIFVDSMHPLLMMLLESWLAIVQHEKL
ncbi:hypothetical protein EVAR_89854_1 [Eumeta japonica]|uniref:Uncharacterized protein n=1 Tax=Eumeta variegata TaxID=151549 RepID=A0A4C1ZYG5_EUMVA|nr:hypothetical protein EVAR_89854_1 [Eumeta japonica]